MRIALASDAWYPQVNGVVRSLSATVERIRRRGIEVETITADQFRTLPCPTYSEIRLAFGCARKVARRLDAFGPDAVHIATEGPIGWAVRRWCRLRHVPFTTSFHTRFPDYVAVRTGLPAAWFWPVMRHFHSGATRVFAVTRTLATELRARGIGPVHHWPLGVDLDQFSPNVGPLAELATLPRPIMLNVGRVAVEKNLDAFLSLDLPGSKVIVGDGPAQEELRQRYPDALFLGAMHGVQLASAYAGADVFVFPSRTDTFGLVNVEALASGLPVAAFPVPGPIDILGRKGFGHHGGTSPIGALDEDLATAIRRALQADRQACVVEAAHYEWDRCTDEFLAGLVMRPVEQPSWQPLREPAWPGLVVR